MKGSPPIPLSSSYMNRWAMHPGPTLLPSVASWASCFRGWCLSAGQVICCHVEQSCTDLQNCGASIFFCRASLSFGSFWELRSPERFFSSANVSCIEDQDPQGVCGLSLDMLQGAWSCRSLNCN